MKHHLGAETIEVQVWIVRRWCRALAPVGGEIELFCQGPQGVEPGLGLLVPTRLNEASGDHPPLLCDMFG